MYVNEESKAFIEMAKEVMEDDVRAAALLACLPKKLRDMTGFTSLHGMGEETPPDSAILALLTQMKACDSRISPALNSQAALEVRTLHLRVRRALKGHDGGGIGAVATAGTLASEEATAASKAVRLYERLEKTQGVRVPPDEQLDYALLHKMAVLYEKNGTINIRVSLKNLVRQCVQHTRSRHTSTPAEH